LKIKKKILASRKILKNSIQVQKCWRRSRNGAVSFR